MKQIGSMVVGTRNKQEEETFLLLQYLSKCRTQLTEVSLSTFFGNGEGVEEQYNHESTDVLEAASNVEDPAQLSS